MADIHQILVERELLIYSHIPLGVFRNSGQWPEPEYEHSLFLYTNDTTERVIEWITYHKLLGFSHFYIYSHHDNPTEFYTTLLPFLDNNNLVTYHHYSIGNLHQAFCHFYYHYSHQTKWIMILNIDEFLCLKKNKNIIDLLPKKYNEVDAYYFNICHYGHNNFEENVNSDVLLNYTARSKTMSADTRVIIQTVSIPYGSLYHMNSLRFQNDYLYLNSGLIICNILGDDLTDYFSEYPQSAVTYLNYNNSHLHIANLGYIAHFGTPSINFITEQDNNERFHYYSGALFYDDISIKKDINYFESFNEVEDNYLYDFWINHLIKAWDTSVFPVNFWQLLSENKVTLQSSTEHECGIQEDSQKLVNGRLTGHAQNLTKIEDNPWWQVDLEDIFLIHEIQIFNRLDSQIYNSSCFEIIVSQDNYTWESLIKQTEPFLYGGMNGSPYVLTIEEGIKGRFVRLILLGQQIQLGLDQIQIFGSSISPTSVIEEE